jgi:hypothetical protein
MIALPVCAPPLGGRAAVERPHGGVSSRTCTIDEGPKKATRGGEWEPIKNPSLEFSLYTKLNTKLISSNSVKTV